MICPNKGDCLYPACKCDFDGSAERFANEMTKLGLNPNRPSVLPESRVVNVVAEIVAGRLVQRIVAPFDLPPGTYNAFLHIKPYGDSPEVAAQRKKFEELASDPSHKFKRSRKGTYVNPAIARDWKWFQLGCIYESERNLCPACHGKREDKIGESVGTCNKCNGSGTVNRRL